MGEHKLNISQWRKWYDIKLSKGTVMAPRRENCFVHQNESNRKLNRILNSKKAVDETILLSDYS